MKIFVILGTQDKEFVRLVKLVEPLIDQHDLVVQLGHTKYTNNKIKLLKYIDHQQFSDYLQWCDIVITHGGVGSIMQALKYHKKVIAYSRLKQYYEHQNDHQKEIVNIFSCNNFIINGDNLNNLRDAIDNIGDFKPDSFISNNINFVNFIKSLIDD